MSAKETTEFRVRNEAELRQDLESAHQALFNLRFQAATRQLADVSQIAKAKRPVILAGHGVLLADATAELLAFADKASIPVAWTLLGIGVIDETHPLAYGYVGMHGWKHVNKAVQAADLIIASMEKSILSKKVTYDFARLLDGAMQVSCSGFGQVMIDNM